MKSQEAASGAIQTTSSTVVEHAGFMLLGTALLITVLFHGVLLFNQSFVHTYDALIHIFFGAHYAESWFDPWETKWYTGFFTVAYPPLSHYLIALLSKLVGLKLGFATVQLGALLLLTVGTYRFSRLLCGPRASGYASIALTLSSAIAETVHVFGQLPTTLSLALLLNAIPFIWHYVRLGRSHDLIKATLWMAATTSAHHVTTLFGSVFFTGPMIVVALLAGFRSPRPNEPTGSHFFGRLRRRLYRVSPRLYRSGLFGFLAITTLILVVFPYWYWSRTDPILQVSIPHGSREDFLEKLNLGFIFWLVPWISALWAFPYLIYKGLLGWRWPVAASVCLLALLGTGGTTPIPRMLLRGAFDILTLDRFTFWATMLILPFAGMAIESAVHGRARRWFDANFGRRVRLLLLLGLVVSTCAVAISVSTLTRYRKFQPEVIDIKPILTFLDKDDHWRYRYLTLGFGDQMAWLAANTRATTPDGNYHSARRLPELTTTPIERLEGAKYTGVPGIGSLEQFLTLPEKYHLKFIFSNDAFYDPLLYFNGWHSLGRLENGIEVWEREDIPPLPERLPRKTWPIYQRLMWGLLPMTAPVLALLALFLPSRTPRPARWQRGGVGAWVWRLLREDALPECPPGTWQPWRRYLRPLEQVFHFTRRPLGARLLATTGLLVSLALPTLFVVNRYLSNQDLPEAAVIEYWDDIDFKRFEQAYGWVEPRNGLDFERWILDLSVVGGLRSGFAKLDAIVPTLIAYEGKGNHHEPEHGDHALVRVQLKWLTTLSEFKETFEHELVRTAGGWRILDEPKLKPRTPEQFIGQPEVAYYLSPRRLTRDLDQTNEVLDRPRLELRNARLVSYHVEKSALELEAEAVFGDVDEEALEPKTTRFSIVGEVQNADIRPADLTITGILRDASGKELSQNNAGQFILHKLLPGEQTPFRIDFDAVAAPEASVDVTDFEVFVKAVVTGRDLSRDLGSWTTLEGNHLQVRVVNLGTKEASIPHALVSLYDDRGLAWVSEAYGMEAIPPYEIREISVELKAPENYLIRSTYLNDEASPTPRNGTPRFPLEHESFRSYLVQLHAYYWSN